MAWFYTSVHVFALQKIAHWSLFKLAERFEHDVTEHRFISSVRENVASGRESGVPGTPTFFIKDVRYTGPETRDAIMSAVRAGLKP
jgi:hypothetical protein